LTPVRYIILLLLVTALAVLSVAQQARVIHLGYRVERLEIERAFLAESSRSLLCEISALSHPARIADEVRRLDIGLLDPVSLTRASADRGSSEQQEWRRFPRR